MKFEALEDFGKFKKGERFESKKKIFQTLAKKGVLKEVRERKKKVVGNAPKNK
jgi:valyl-tRNA synthetase